MTITLTGTRAEIRRWLMRQRRMTGAKINYTCVETEDGLTVCVMQEGTKKDYPRQRIVRQFTDALEIEGCPSETQCAACKARWLQQKAEGRA